MNREGNLVSRDLFIRSGQNPRVKSGMRLRDRRGRERQQRIVIDGRREIAAALRAGVRLEELFLDAAACEQPELLQLHQQAAAAGATCLTVESSVFARLAFGDRNEGVCATAATPARGLELVQAVVAQSPQPLIAVVEGVEKPGNLGAIARSADAAGVTALVSADGRTDLFNPNTIRASLGCIFHLPACAAAGEDVRRWLQTEKIPCFAARVDADHTYADVDWTQPAAVVLGSEAEGLTDRWSGTGVTPISLPMRGTVDSLNVSVTAAVLFFEAQRQRLSV